MQRLVVRLIDAPLPVRPRFARRPAPSSSPTTGQGTAQELADRLARTRREDRARPPCGIGRRLRGRPHRPGRGRRPSRLRFARKCGPISGLIHLLPLAEPRRGETPRERVDREVKSLYLLARGLENDIRAAANGPAVLLAVTAMGGTMGFGDDLPADFFAGHGGVAGFTKCLGYEWPEVTVRVVDVDPRNARARLVEQLLAELGDPDGPFEVGRDGDRRVTWQVDPGPLEKDSPAVELDPRIRPC